MSGQSSPHDAVFRRVFGEPANAASQLRAVLPAALVTRLGLDQLKPVPGSFVDTDLSSRYSDLVFTVPLDGRDAFVYVLVEHQSGTDAMMPFRMLQYTVRIWDQYLAEHPTTSRLPAVIPVVVHHNKRPWSGPTELADVIDLAKDTAAAIPEFVPRFRFLLDDLAIVDEHVLRERPLTPTARVTLLLLKTAAGNTHLAEHLQPWHHELRAILNQPGGLETFRLLVTYIETVAETPADELHDLFAHLGPDEEEAYVTTAEMLRTEGRAEALLQLLAIKFGPVPQTALDTVRSATDKQLETWTARIFTADTLDDVLR